MYDSVQVVTLSFGESFIRLSVFHITVPSSPCNTARSCLMLPAVSFFEDMLQILRLYAHVQSYRYMGNQTKQILWYGKYRREYRISKCKYNRDNFSISSH